MKKYTLNQTWKHCLAMWKWIAKEIKTGSTKCVELLKVQWLEDNGFDDIYMDCFFCHYDTQRNGWLCDDCPGKKVSGRFNCIWETCHYYDEPVKFYKKLLQLNRKRLKK